MKILKGRYEPVLGLSTDLTAIINRCLSQAAARRPSAERLLSLPCVRAKAAELGIELPPCVLAAPLASPGGSFIVGEGASPRKRSVLPSLQAVADARRSSNGGAVNGNGRPASRRATCPHSPAQLPPGADRPPKPVVGRRSTPHIPLEERWLSGAERHNLRMKPPLPAAAVPRRRLTEQAAAAGRQPLQGSLQGECALQLQGSPASPEPAAPLQSGAAGALAAAAAVAALTLAPAPAPAPQAAAAPTAHDAPAAQQAPPRRHSHFSVTKHMRALSGVAQQWLAQRASINGSGGEGGASEDATSPADSAAAGLAASAAVPTAARAVVVQRSAVSDSVLQVSPWRLAEQAEAVPLPEASAAEEEEEDEEGGQAAVLDDLRRRCVALLGCEQAFEELYSLAQSAMVDGSDGSSAGGAPAAPRPPTIAALADALFARVGYSSNAARALHLLMRMLAVE